MLWSFTSEDAPAQGGERQPGAALARVPVAERRLEPAEVRVLAEPQEPDEPRELAEPREPAAAQAQVQAAPPGLEPPDERPVPAV